MVAPLKASWPTLSLSGMAALLCVKGKLCGRWWKPPGTSLAPNYQPLNTFTTVTVFSGHTAWSGTFFNPSHKPFDLLLSWWRYRNILNRTSRFRSSYQHLCLSLISCSPFSLSLHLLNNSLSLSLSPLPIMFILFFMSRSLFPCSC